MVKTLGDNLTLRLSRPGMHPLYYGLQGSQGYIHWDESEWRLHRRLRGLGVAKPKVAEVEGGQTVVFNGREVKVFDAPITVPDTVAVGSMAQAQDEFWDRLVLAVKSIYERHGGGRVMVLLSGGVDSILILQALCEAGANVEAVTAGLTPDDFDPLWAARLCHHWGVPWHFVRVPTEDDALQALLTRAVEVIEQTSFSNVLMGCCMELIRDKMIQTDRKIGYMGFFGDLLFGHKLQVTGSFNKLPAAQRTDAGWTEKRITHCWHSKPHSLQLAKGMRHGGTTTWRVPFVHENVASYAFGLPLSVAPAVMDKPLLYGLADRFVPAHLAAWHVQKKIGFYTGAGIGKVRLVNPILQDANIQRTYKLAKQRLS